jgi:hypothetical protein
LPVADERLAKGSTQHSAAIAWQHPGFPSAAPIAAAEIVHWLKLHLLNFGQTLALALLPLALKAVRGRAPVSIQSAF